MMKKNGKSRQSKRTKPKELCDFCGGTLIPKVVSVEFRVKGDLIVIEDVPAEVCNRCGEKYLPMDAYAGIERLRWAAA
jgi:YgiT-type zinc finger domain-containing protein